MLKKIRKFFGLDVAETPAETLAPEVKATTPKNPRGSGGKVKLTSTLIRGDYVNDKKPRVVKPL